MDPLHKFARSSLFGGLAGLGSSLGTFLSSIVLARVLGPSGLGEVSYALWVAVLAALVVDLGMSTVVQRYLPELLARGEDAEAGALARAAAGAGLIACSVLLIGFALLGHFHAPADQGTAQRIPWLIIGLLSVGVFVSTFVSGLLTGMQQFGLLAVRSLVILVAQPSAIGLGAWIAGPPGAALGHACSLLLLTLGLAAAPRAKGRLSPALRSRVLRYGLFAWSTGLVATFVWGQFEIVFLKAFASPTDIGQFSVALAYALLVSNGPLLFMRGLLPHFAARASTQDRHSLEQYYRTTQRVAAFTILPSASAER